MKYIICLIAIMSVAKFYAQQEHIYKDRPSWNRLMKATFNQSYDKMGHLLEAGFDINEPSEDGNTAVIIAIKEEDTTALKLLLKHQKIDIASYGNLIMIASSNGSAKVLEILINEGVPIKNNKNYSPLMAAASFGSTEVLEYLLSLDLIDINQQNSGTTALMLAAHNGSLEKVKLLLDHGANKTVKDSRGDYAFDYIHDKEFQNTDDSTYFKLKELLKVSE